MKTAKIRMRYASHPVTAGEGKQNDGGGGEKEGAKKTRIRKHSGVPQVTAHLTNHATPNAVPAPLLIHHECDL